MITIFCRHSFVCPNQGPGRLRRLVGDILLILAVLLIADVIFVMPARINAEIHIMSLLDPMKPLAQIPELFLIFHFMEAYDMAKQNIYDNDAFFESFRSSRNDHVNFNDCIETPILFGMLPDLEGKTVLDIGCGMGQHAKQYSLKGAESVLGIDISEKMLAYAQEHNSAENIIYQRMAMEDIETIGRHFDLITSSLVFDYAEDFPGLMRKIHNLMKEDASFVFSMSHPIVTAWDGVYDRYTRTETGERLYANLRNYCLEGPRKVDWVVNGYECYHRTVSTLINALIGAGFMIEECQEAHISDDLRKQYPALFGGTVHRPEFIFFRCRKISDR